VKLTSKTNVEAGPTRSISAGSRSGGERARGDTRLSPPRLARSKAVLLNHTALLVKERGDDGGYIGPTRWEDKSTR